MRLTYAQALAAGKRTVATFGGYGDAELDRVAAEQIAVALLEQENGR